MAETLRLIEFTMRIGASLQRHPELRNVWVIAELSDVAVRGGHFYATLIDKNNEGVTIARMRANLWANNYREISRKYFAERQEELRNGIKVKLYGSVSHHNEYGLSFNISDIDPTYVDEGDILRRRMEILEQMKKIGVFDQNRELTLPADCQRIAVISAPGAAGLGDFMNQLENSPERFRFKVRLFESTMQGEKAPGGVRRALGEIENEIEEWDCVVIIRGGGATADMNCFDNEELARAVCMYPLPVIVGIGHERDNCVLDYIANTRCKTPTAVAEFLINHQREAWQAACDAMMKITREATLRIEGEQRHMAQIETFVPAFATQMIERETLRLKNFTTAIPLASGTLTTREHTRLDGYLNQLAPAATATITRAKDNLRAIFGLLEVLKPENTLKRGYSITRVDGKAVKNSDALAEGTVLETQLAEGIVKSVVNGL